MALPVPQPHAAHTDLTRPFVVVKDLICSTGTELHMGDPATRNRDAINQGTIRSVIAAEKAVQSLIPAALIDHLRSPQFYPSRDRFDHCAVIGGRNAQPAAAVADKMKAVVWRGGIRAKARR